MTLSRLGLIAAIALAWLDAGAPRAQEQESPADEQPLSEEPLDEDDLDALFRELEKDVAPPAEPPADATPDATGEDAPDPPVEPGEEDTSLPSGAEADETVETERRQATRLRPGKRSEEDAEEVGADADDEARQDRDIVEGEASEEDPASEDAAATEGVMIPREAFIQQPGAELRALDKITGRYVDLSVDNGQPVVFGTLEVTVETCYDTPPELPREASAFVKVKSLRPIAPESMPEDVAQRLEGLDEDDPRVLEPLVFSGWMYASSPGLNAMEHPVYDIWVISCNASPPEIIGPTR